MNIVDRELWRQTHEQLLRDNATYREFFSGNLDVLRPSVPAGAPGAATSEIPHAQQPKKIAVDPVNVDGVFSPPAKVATPVTPDIPRAATPTIAPHEAVQVYSTAMMAAREASVAILPGRAPVPQAPEVERPSSSPTIPEPSQNRTAAVVQNDATETPMVPAARFTRPEAPAATANRSEIPNSSISPVSPVDRSTSPRSAERPQSLVRTVFSRVAEAFGFASKVSPSSPVPPSAASSSPAERPAAPAADLPRYVRPGDAPATAVSSAVRPESPTAPQIAPAARPESAPVQRQGVESPSVASLASVPSPVRPESPSATFARYVRHGDLIEGDFSKAARPESPSVAVPPRVDRPVSPGVSAESPVSPLAPMVAVRPSVGPQSPSSPDLTHAARPDVSPFSVVSPHPMRLPSLGVSPQGARGQDATADLLGKILKALEPKSQTPQYQPPAPPMAKPLDRKFAHLLGGS